MRRWIAGMAAAGVIAAGITGLASPAQALDGHMAVRFKFDEKKERYTLDYRKIVIDESDMPAFYLGGAAPIRPQSTNDIAAELEEAIWVIDHSTRSEDIRFTYDVAVKHYSTRGIEKRIIIVAPYANSRHLMLDN